MFAAASAATTTVSPLSSIAAAAAAALSVGDTTTSCRWIYKLKDVNVVAGNTFVQYKGVPQQLHQIRLHWCTSI